MIVWITGLSGAGKTTLAGEVCRLLRQEERSVVSLDGDELRGVFRNLNGGEQRFDRKSRVQLGLQYSRLCRLLAQQEFDVVIATISLFSEVHAWNRLNLTDYFEVYLEVPEETLRKRDPKGIYRRFDNNELENVAGLDLEVDKPLAPDWAPSFDANNTPPMLADTLKLKLSDRGML